MALWGNLNETIRTGPLKLDCPINNKRERERERERGGCVLQLCMTPHAPQGSAKFHLYL
jgi:hypothetical protein